MDSVCLKTDVHCSISLEWTNKCKQVDLDLQGVLVDERGYIIDAVYYNNPTGLYGAIDLNADLAPSGGRAPNNHECMGFKLEQISDSISMIIIVVAVNSTGHLRDVDGFLTLMEGKVQSRHIRLENSRGDVDVVGYMYHNLKTGWEFFTVKLHAMSGSHFLDVLEPEIGDLIRNRIPNAPSSQGVAFQMQKGAITALPQTDSLRRINICMGGWLRLGCRHAVDIDISAVFWNRDEVCIGGVDSENDELYGCRHSGDEVVSGGGGDEAITLDLISVPVDIISIFLVFNVTGGSFADVRKAYIRAVDQSANEVARFNMVGGENFGALIVSQVIRTAAGRWEFHAIGQYLESKNKKSDWKAFKPQMLSILKETHCRKETARKSGMGTSSAALCLASMESLPGGKTGSMDFNTPVATGTSLVRISHQTPSSRPPLGRQFTATIKDVGDEPAECEVRSIQRQKTRQSTFTILPDMNDVEVQRPVEDEEGDANKCAPLCGCIVKVN